MTWEPVFFLLAEKVTGREEEKKKEKKEKEKKENRSVRSRTSSEETYFSSNFSLPLCDFLSIA